MKAKAIKNLAVVSIDDGVKLGYVDDVIVDSRRLRVAALHIKADGRRGLIPFDQIRTIGRDAVTVPHDVTRWGDDPGAAGMSGLDALHKLKVVDEGGTFLGTVQELEVAPEDGRVTELQIAKGGVLGIGGETHRLAADQVTSVGDEVLVVAVHDHATEREGRR